MAEEILQQSKWPLVSIVTPSLNQVRYLEEAICSVLEQDYPNIEHIVIDGGSMDGTLEVLKNYGDKIRWLSEPDNGQTEALNKGFRLAKGQILGWLNADDLYKPHTVKVAVEFLQAHPDVAMVHGAGLYIDQAGNVIMRRESGDFGLEKLICVNTIMSISAFFRRRVLDQVGYLDETLCYVMDWEYWIRVAMAGLKIRYIPGPILALSREHNDCKTMQSKERFWQQRFQVFETIFSSPDTPDEIKRLEKRAYSGVYASSAHFYLRYGQLGKAVSALWKAVRMWPGVLFMYSPLFVAKNLLEVVKANLYLRRQSLQQTRLVEDKKTSSLTNE